MSKKRINKKRSLEEEPELKALRPEEARVIIPKEDRLQESDIVEGRFNLSGPLVRERLRPRSMQVKLWEDLGASNPKLIEAATNLNVSTIGLHNLTVNERLCMDSLLSLLYKADPIHYIGNTFATTATNEIKPSLIITPQDFYKAFAGDERPAGNIVKRAKEALSSLSAKGFVMCYDGENSKGEKVKVEPAAPEPILSAKYISVEKYVQNRDSYAKTGVALPDPASAKKEFLVIEFHPITRAQIQSTYTALPDDYSLRVRIAAKAENARLTAPILDLVLYLARQASMIKGGKSKNKKDHIIGYNRLLSSVGLVDSKNPKRNREKIEIALRVAIALGVLESYSIKKYNKTAKRADGELEQVVLKIRSNWLDKLPKLQS